MKLLKNGEDCTIEIEAVTCWYQKNALEVDREGAGSRAAPSGRGMSRHVKVFKGSYLPEAEGDVEARRTVGYFE